MKMLFRLVGPVLTVLILGAVGWWLVSQAHFAVFSPAGVVAEHEKNLLVFTLALSLVVVIPVFIMLWLFAWKFRASNTKARYRPDWDKNTVLETIWWGIPIAIIAVLGVVMWQSTHALDPYRDIESDKKPVEVQVVALQWKWLFIYPDQNVAMVNKLVLPVDRPVRFSLTADAPMSAFWIPKLGSQIYSMNGMSTELNLMATKPGTYEGYNTNINGEGYAKMTFAVEAKPETEYLKTLTAAASAPRTLDEKQYTSLAKPGTVAEPIMYRLASRDLYDTIVMKYMHGMSSEKHHDMTAMEGM